MRDAFEARDGRCEITEPSSESFSVGDGSLVSEALGVSVSSSSWKQKRREPLSELELSVETRVVSELKADKKAIGEAGR